MVTDGTAGDTPGNGAGKGSINTAGGLGVTKNAWIGGANGGLHLEAGGATINGDGMKVTDTGLTIDTGGLKVLGTGGIVVADTSIGQSPGTAGSINTAGGLGV